MGDNGALRGLFSAVLVLASGFFVAAEYSLVSLRRSKVEALARKGNRNASGLLQVLDNLSPSIAGTQIAITLIGIALGSFTEPYVTEVLAGLVPSLDRRVGFAVAFLFVAFVLVVIGELCPKYLTIRSAEKVALITYRPLKAVVLVLRPLIWLAHGAAGLLLKPFGVDLDDHVQSSIPKEELLMLVQTGGADGMLDKNQADLVTRALKIDLLAARDIMVHRLDIKWIDAKLSGPALMTQLCKIPYHRIPICRGDIDDMVGIVYLHDIIKNLDNLENLEKIARPVVAIPENLAMERIVQTMREQKTQMLVVMDEYGGTSGLVTLEDVVEEVFGELEDRLESERPTIEIMAGGRISARAEVRYDELVSRLELPVDPGDNTETLATILVNRLERVPRPGDSVEMELGRLRVENMARRRITRVTLNLAEGLKPPLPPAHGGNP